MGRTHFSWVAPSELASGCYRKWVLGQVGKLHLFSVGDSFSAQAYGKGWFTNHGSSTPIIHCHLDSSLLEAGVMWSLWPGLFSVDHPSAALSDASLQPVRAEPRRGMPGSHTCLVMLLQSDKHAGLPVPGHDYPTADLNDQEDAHESDLVWNVPT